MSYTDFLKSKVVVAPKSGFELAQSELNPALWHDLEMERHAIKAALPEAVEVYGTLDLDERERRVVDFAEGRTRLLATKKKSADRAATFNGTVTGLFSGHRLQVQRFYSGDSPHIPLFANAESRD